MRYSINLFPPKEKSLIDKAIYFAFHYLRYILVFTQLVVIYVFFFRFSVDQQIVDLKDTLNQKQEIVSVVSPLLKQADKVSKKITFVSRILQRQENVEGSTEYILSRFPEKLTLTKMVLTDTGVDFEGFTDDVEAVRLFYNKLKAEKQFKTIDLNNVSKIESGYKFSFRLRNFVRS